jgi:hypothetical protein
MCFCFSDLVFYPYFCIDNFILFFVEKVISFTLYIRMMVELKNIYLIVVSSYTYKFLWNWKKYIKKIVIFYYISGYHFTSFFLLYFLWFCSFFTFFFCPYFLIYIIFLFKLLLYFFFFLFPFLNFTLNSRKPWREIVYINCCFEYEVWLFFNLHCSLNFFFPCIMHIVNVLNW